eukprot:873659-Rhodomonas_salina.1
MEGVTFVDAATNTEPVGTKEVQDIPCRSETSGSEATPPACKDGKCRQARKKGGKRQALTGVVKKTKGVRRPYRGLEDAKLGLRVVVMQQRSDSLTEKLERANGSLYKLKEELQHRGPA